jgi:hypothetical protein
MNARTLLNTRRTATAARSFQRAFAQTGNSPSLFTPLPPSEAAGVTDAAAQRYAPAALRRSYAFAVQNVLRYAVRHAAGAIISRYG